MCEVFACDQSLSPLLPVRRSDFRNLFLCFPFCLSPHLALRTLWSNVLDVGAIRRHVRRWKRSAQASVALTASSGVSVKICEESGCSNRIDCAGLNNYGCKCIFRDLMFRKLKLLIVSAVGNEGALKTNSHLKTLLQG